MTLQFLTLDMIKSHLRIDDDLSDAELEMYAASAEQAALNYLQCTLTKLKEDNDDAVPAPVIHACLLRVATSYKFREDITDRNLYRLPYTWDTLLLPYVSPSKI